MKGKLTGGCLCGAVRYTLHEGFRLNPYACHCTDCQSRTGSAFSEHMLFGVSEPTREGTIWESRKDVHTWALLSGGVDKAQNWRKYAS